MDDFKCKRTLRSAFVVQILLVSDKDKYIFCAGQIEDKNKQKQKKPDGVVAVWPGHPEKKPIRLLRGFGRLVRSLYAPVDPGENKCIAPLATAMNRQPESIFFVVLTLRRDHTSS